SHIKADFFLQVGVHGIWIEFVDDHNRRRTATYLPEVAEEQGWTKEEAIDSLLRKSGHSGRITDKIRNRIVLTRYQSAKYSITYEEYLQYNNNSNSEINKVELPKHKLIIDGFDAEELN
ncbi:1033_t:CDS:2, partial [Acaulospora colombiana]